jgi:hypothetical protein
VLFEMRRAMRIFNAAAAKGFGERLVPLEPHLHG